MFSFQDFNLKSQMKSLAGVKLLREKMKDGEGRNHHRFFLENLATRESLLALHTVLLTFSRGLAIINPLEEAWRDGNQ